MISRYAFHQLWPPILLIFQLFGFATYTRAARTRFRLLARLCVTLGVMSLMFAISAYTLLTKLTIHEANQVNVMSDQSVYLTVLPAHLIALLEALLKQRHSEHLFEHAFDIVDLLSTANGAQLAVDWSRFRRTMLWKNWSQVIGLVALMAIGIGLTGLQSWMYFRWIVLAQLFASVRLLEVAMHAELLTSLMGSLEVLLKANCNGDREKLDRLQCAAAIYGRIHQQAEAISLAFGWSTLAISVYALNGMINNSYWFVYATYTGAVKMYARQRNDR